MAPVEAEEGEVSKEVEGSSGDEAGTEEAKVEREAPMVDTELGGSMEGTAQVVEVVGEVVGVGAAVEDEEGTAGSKVRQAAACPNKCTSVGESVRRQ